jgi:hypothetical protein
LHDTTHCSDIEHPEEGNTANNQTAEEEKEKLSPKLRIGLIK